MSVSGMTAINNDLLKKLIGASKIAQWIKVLIGKPDDPRLIPGTHVTRGEKSRCKLSSNFHCISWRAHTSTPNRQTNKKASKSN